MEMTEEKQEFDRAQGELCTEEQIFTENCSEIINNVMEGGVGTIIAFGQTGSGKTHTISNMIDRVCAQIFTDIQTLSLKYSSKDSNTPNTPNASGIYNIYQKSIEILGSKCSDLQGQKNPVRIMENKHGKIEVQDCVESEHNSSQSLSEAIKAAMSERSTNSTGKNDTSSRSHAINLIRVKNNVMKEAEDGILYLIDLAGSERNADSKDHDKLRIKESKEINTSLMNLKDCIRNRTFYLVEEKQQHIPFRSNKMTLLLKEMLEVENHRSSRSLFICCTSPSTDDVMHTQNSLKQSVCLFTTDSTSFKPKEQDPKDPSSWTNVQLRQHIQSLTKQKLNLDVLCQECSGRQLLDLPEAEFLLRCRQFGFEGIPAKTFQTRFWALQVDVRSRKKKEKITESEWTKETKALREKKKHLSEHDMNTDSEVSPKEIINEKMHNAQFKKAQKAIL